MYGSNAYAQQLNALYQGQGQAQRAMQTAQTTLQTPGSCLHAIALQDLQLAQQIAQAPKAAKLVELLGIKTPQSAQVIYNAVCIDQQQTGSPAAIATRGNPATQHAAAAVAGQCQKTATAVQETNITSPHAAQQIAQAVQIEAYMDPQSYYYQSPYAQAYNY